MDDEVMKLPAGVKPRGAVFWQRIVIPKDLRHLYPRTSSGQLATTHSYVSLGTSDPAEARVRALERRAGIEAEFLAKRKTMTGYGSVMVERVSPDLQRSLVEHVQRLILQADDARRADSSDLKRLLYVLESVIPSRVRYLTAGDPLTRPGYLDEPAGPWGSLGPLTLARLRQVDDGMADIAKVLLATGDLSLAVIYAGALTRNLGFLVAWERPENRAALLAVMRALVGAYLSIAGRSKGEPIETSDVHDPIPVPAASTQATHLADVLPDWKAKRHPSLDSVKKTEHALRLLKQAGFDRPLADLTKIDGVKMRDWLRSPERTFKQKTAHNHWLSLTALLNIAAEYGKLERNPWAGMDFPVEGSKSRAEWTHEELRTIYGSSLFTSATYRPIYRVQSWDAYFMLLLGLWTGARIGELAQLECADVLAINGIPVVDIHEEAEGSTVKSEDSIRRVPIADELVRLGLLDYAEANRKAGQVKLFPSLHRGGKVTPGDVMGEWFRGFRADHGLEPGPLNGFHRYRHTIRSALAEHDVGPETADALTGHAAVGSTGRTDYTHIRLTKVQAALRKPLFPFLSLSRVYPV